MRRRFTRWSFEREAGLIAWLTVGLPVIGIVLAILLPVLIRWFSQLTSASLPTR